MNQLNHKQYEYFAFISYKREDEKWAKWLQRKLEYYKLPSSVRKDNPGLPERIRPVFKDTTDLEPGVLAQKILNALDSSKFLIVICSPRSANSVWVSKEVQSFIDSGRADHIIPFIIGGTPNAPDSKEECFPEGLRQLSGEQELLGANINEMGREAAAIKVVARMFSLRFDALWQRYERLRHKRLIVIIAIALLAIIIATSFGLLYIDRAGAYTKLNESNKNLELTIRQLSESKDSIKAGNIRLKLANDSIKAGNERLKLAKDSIDNTNAVLKSTISQLHLTNNLLAKEKAVVERTNKELLIKHAKSIANIAKLEIEKGNLEQSILALLTVIPCDDNMPYVPEVEAALRLAYEKINSGGWSYTIIDGYYDDFEASDDGKYVRCINNDIIDTYDFNTYSKVNLNPSQFSALKTSGIAWIGENKVIAENKNVVFLGTIEKTTEIDGDYCSYSLLEKNSGKEIIKLDNSGELYNSLEFNSPTYASFSPDASKIIISFWDGHQEIYNCHDGKLISSWKCEMCDHYSNWNKFGNNHFTLHSSRFEYGIKIRDARSTLQVDSLPNITGGEIYDAISNSSLDKIWTMEENVPIVHSKTKKLEPSESYDGFILRDMNHQNKLTTLNGSSIYVKNGMIECVDTNNKKCWEYNSHYGCSLYNLYDNDRLVIICNDQRFYNDYSFVDILSGETVYRIKYFSDIFTNITNDIYIFSQTSYIPEQNFAYIVLPYSKLIERCSDMVKEQRMTNITKQIFNI